MPSLPNSYLLSFSVPPRPIPFASTLQSSINEEKPVAAENPKIVVGGSSCHWPLQLSITYVRSQLSIHDASATLYSTMRMRLAHAVMQGTMSLLQRLSNSRIELRHSRPDRKSKPASSMTATVARPKGRTMRASASLFVNSILPLHPSNLARGVHLCVEHTLSTNSSLACQTCWIDLSPGR